jgi:hypothetical protein
MVLVYQSSPTTMETHPNPWTTTLVLSMPHHSAEAALAQVERR